VINLQAIKFALRGQEGSSRGMIELTPSAQDSVVFLDWQGW
jgi:hypothetical protein